VALAFDVLKKGDRVEHVQCLPQDLGARLNQGVLCSVQPSHLMSDWRAADRHWGSRSARTYAFRTMLQEGATLAFGSDAPVEPADPRHGLYAAVARMDPTRCPGHAGTPSSRSRSSKRLPHTPVACRSVPARWRTSSRGSKIL
jgi:predicted amidohydrolase YtcJ